MKASVEPVEGNKVKLSIEVDEDEFEPEVEAAWRRLASQVRIKGFRPGKAPRSLLERQLGAGVGREEALREGLPGFYARAVIDNDVDVIAPPSIDITSGQEEGAINFDAVVEVRPIITVEGYEDLTVTIPSPVATDDEVDAQIERLRQQFGELTPVERPIVDGDFATVDISGTLDGEAQDGLTAEDYLYEVGQGAVVEAIDDELRGASVGDILEFGAEHPDPEEDGELRFRILVKEVKEKVLPDLDNDFASEASEFETLDELRADMAERIASVRRGQALMALEDATAEALAGLVTEDVPEALIAQDVQERLENFAMRLSTQGIELASWLEMTGTSQEDFLGQLTQTASRAVRSDLALRAIATAESVEADDEDLEAEYARVAEQLEADIEEVRAQVERNEAVRQLRSELRVRKTLQWVSERVSLVDEDGNAIDRAALEAPESAGDEDATENPVTEGEDDDQ